MVHRCSGSQKAAAPRLAWFPALNHLKGRYYEVAPRFERRAAEKASLRQIRQHSPNLCGTPLTAH
jgi:hypothetical protein